MKRKLVAVLLIGILALTACSVSGCTSTTAKDYSQHYNDAFKSVNATVISPFSKSKSTDNNDLYTGAGKYTESGYTANNTTVAIEIMPSQTAAQAKFDKVVADQMSAGYSNITSSTTVPPTGYLSPMGTVKSAWLGVKNQTGEPVGMQILLTQDSGADNNWTVSTVTFAGLARSAANTTTSIGETNASQAITSNPTVNVTATSLGEATGIKSTYGSVQTTPLPGSKFVKFAMYFQNINASNYTSLGNPLYVTLRDKQGTLYSYDSSQYTMQPEQVGGQTLKGLTPQSGTQPGEKVSGIIVFEIPQSAQPKNLTYYDYTNRIVIEL
ncbi:MAG: DUF4352 domain-containing protein [Halobacteriota archaeon]